jgi:hypothetical protein
LPSNLGRYDPNSYRQRSERGSGSYKTPLEYDYTLSLVDDAAPIESRERRSLTPRTSRESVGPVDGPNERSKDVSEELLRPALSTLGNENMAGDEGSPQTEVKIPLEQATGYEVTLPAVQQAENRTEPKDPTKVASETVPPMMEDHKDATEATVPALEGIDAQVANDIYCVSNATSNIEQEQPTETDVLHPSSMDQAKTTLHREENAPLSGAALDLAPEPPPQSLMVRADSGHDRFSSALTGVGSAYDQTGAERKVSIDEDFDVSTTAPAEASRQTDG